MCGRGNCDGSCEDDDPREPDMWDVPEVELDAADYAADDADAANEGERENRDE